jgi:hypothetical protein
MTEWVTCPICGGTDMSAEKDVGLDGEIVLLVRCTNLECKSNVKVAPEGPIETTIFFHRDKESNYDLMHHHNLPDSLRDTMLYIGYEIAVRVEIDSETGKTFATHFEGVELPTKVKMS